MNEHSEAASVPPTSTVARRPRPPASAEEKAEWVKRFHESGLSLRKFSAQHSVSLMSICRWVNQAKDPQPASGTTPQFEELPLRLLAADSDWAVELTLPNGTVLRLSKEAPPAMVDQLLRIC
jgi:transposase-like protein